MPHDSYQNEKRKFPRFKLRDLAIAVPNKPTSQVGRIVNISKGGMAVRYLEQEDWGDDADTIDILINNNLFLTSVPVQNVNDFKVDSYVPLSVTRERQCCFKFGRLSLSQEKLLDTFIMLHTAGNS
jgi:hypothetical protein